MNNNNFLWSGDTLQIALKSCLLNEINQNVFTTEIFLDSRKIVADGIFLAIIGENFDGHN